MLKKISVFVFEGGKMKKLIILTFLFFVACSNHSSVPDSANTKARYIFSDKNGLFGLLDENGKEVIPAEYLYIDNSRFYDQKRVRFSRWGRKKDKRCQIP